jgi:hypothetical protein
MISQALSFQVDKSLILMDFVSELSVQSLYNPKSPIQNPKSYKVSTIQNPKSKIVLLLATNANGLTGVESWLPTVSA